MAELVYDENGRLLFTKEMKEEYTILFPTMLPVHFGLMARILETEGFHVEMLTTNHRGIVDEGLKYVHNDTCYPALLVIGQLIDAVKSGKYDMHKVALLITQTGGGCRASNYIHLLRKALEKAGLSYIPVISVNLSGLEPNPGFKLGLNTLRKAVFAMMYGDIIVQTANQVRPYEVSRGQTDETIDAVEGTVPRENGEVSIASYMNFLIVNGGVILPQYGDENDALAVRQVQEMFPDREVVGVQTREVAFGGGNIHCITQQQPRP